MVRTTPAPRFDIAAIVPEIAALAKVTVRLHPRPGPESAVNASKLGGRFLWPADEEWPRCMEPEWPQDGWTFDLESPELPEPPEDLSARLHEHIYVPILQLRRDEFPELQFPEGKDLFQLLWCPNDHFWQISPVCKAIWRAEAEITNPRATMPRPTPIEEEYLPRPCQLHPERIIEYPDQGLPLEIAAAIERWESTAQEYDLYWSELSAAPGTKLGGYPQWIQGEWIPDCECGHPMEHLLTIASPEHRGRSWQRWCPVEDFDALDETDQSTGIMLGDVGSMYVFICRRCPNWPIDWKEQMH